ncbi:MAG: N(5)-(carboxyethyl)ornithine synthase [Frankiaceae bacterium]
MPQLRLGILATSGKPAERRLPLHPRHFGRVPPQVRPALHLETGYGERFGVPDSDLAPLVAGLGSRKQLIAQCDVILLPKPVHADVAELRPGSVLWGWPHCVQDATITQLAIDQKLTMIAWEAMNYWTAEDTFDLHVFHKNNELAGYSSVLHAFALRGITGAYGRRLRAVVISFGATGRGAVIALEAMGVSDVTVITLRDVHAVAAPFPSATMGQFERVDEAWRNQVLTGRGPVPLAEFLAGFDVVVNCVRQDTDAPLMFVTAEEVTTFRSGTLLIDVSCDEGMGFSFARATSFAEPVFSVGDGVTYYGVDHSPSYLWNSATWEISEALIPFLEPLVAGPQGWERNATLRHAVEIRDGVVQNPSILSFQGRAAEYPHERRAG